MKAEGPGALTSVKRSFFRHPATIAAGKGIGGIMQENAALQKSVGIVQNVPDYKQAIDATYLVRYTKGK